MLGRTLMPASAEKQGWYCNWFSLKASQVYSCILPIVRTRVARVLTSAGGTNGSGYAFRNPDVPFDELGRFQIHRAGHAVGCGGRLRSNGRPASMQYLRDIGMNVCGSICLEDGDKERETAP